MLAQQAAEKALKAALISLDIDPPRVHNLELLADLLPEGWAVRSAKQDLGRLSLWIVESRYPGDWPDEGVDGVRFVKGVPTRGRAAVSPDNVS